MRNEGRIFQARVLEPSVFQHKHWESLKTQGGCARICWWSKHINFMFYVSGRVENQEPFQCNQPTDPMSQT